jgi:SAM-dependent methyltransferase
MAEIRTGLRHILALPFVYDTFQQLVGAYAWRRRVIENQVLGELEQAGALLDIGCGTADVLSYLPQAVRYVGFDRNPSYIAQAKQRFADRNAQFMCEEFRGTLSGDGDKFDVVLALGLLHHLDDDEALKLFESAANVLKDGGIFLTLDPLIAAEQSPFARYIVTHDRGKNVRTLAHYAELAKARFPQTEAFVDNRPLRIPYTGIVLRCRKSSR